jgi:hypothetical protein
MIVEKIGNGENPSDYCSQQPKIITFDLTTTRHWR